MITDRIVPTLRDGGALAASVGEEGRGGVRACRRSYIASGGVAAPAGANGALKTPRRGSGAPRVRACRRSYRNRHGFRGAV